MSKANRIDGVHVGLNRPVIWTDPIGREWEATLVRTYTSRTGVPTAQIRVEGCTYYPALSTIREVFMNDDQKRAEHEHKRRGREIRILAEGFMYEMIRRDGVPAPSREQTVMANRAVTLAEKFLAACDASDFIRHGTPEPEPTPAEVFDLEGAKSGRAPTS